jgi:hypothetical protein
MISKLTLAFAALLVFMTVPAFADPGCRNGKFVGSYTSPSPASDVFGDTTAVHAFTFQLTLHSDGTANQFWTGLPDFQNTLGTGSPWIGSWKCRSDGKVVVTLIRATYLPTNNPNVIERPDVELVNHVRNTYLFSVVDDNTLQRIQARARVYTPSQDPTVATGGTLGNLSTTVIEYKRLVASDADLLAP